MSRVVVNTKREAISIFVKIINIEDIVWLYRDIKVMISMQSNRVNTLFL